MSSIKQKYFSIIKNAYNVARYDYFPQVEASEFLFKRITLEDIYLPLSLDFVSEDSVIDYDLFSENFDVFREYIDNKYQKYSMEWDDINKKLKSFGRFMQQYIFQQRDTSLSISKSHSISTSIDGELRIVIEGDPGCGKTTFCKRLVLALIKDDNDFFEKLEKDNGISFKKNMIPILVECKYISNLRSDAIKNNSFESILYKLCKSAIGEDFSLTIDEFKRLKSEGNGFIIVLDGLDEAYDYSESNYGNFITRLDDFVTINNETNLLITRRKSYLQPKLTLPYTGTYAIKALSIEDTEKFCEKWVSEILSNDLKGRRNYRSIIDQITSSTDSQIINMRANPLELSLLLTISKNEGRLPENKADLFKKLVDLYIYWSTNKNGSKLSEKSIRILLSYIAASFTKEQIIYCNKQKIKTFIDDCIVELDGIFSQDVSRINKIIIINELIRTGLLTTTYGGKSYSFSESTKGAHRQIQEFLTAYAIQAQYAVAEYNNMPTLELLENEYNSPRWREIIVFLALMEDGRLKQEIVQFLITKTIDKPEDSNSAKEILFRLLTNGIDINKKYAHKIYSLLFSDSISDKQIEGIGVLLKTKNKKSEDFVKYIDEQFQKSVEKGNDNFCYAKAIIETFISFEENKSPFKRVIELLDNTNDITLIITGCSIINILSWCKYMDINNLFIPINYNETIKKQLEQGLNKLIQNSEENLVCLSAVKCIREMIIARVAEFEDFFSKQDIVDCLKIVNCDDNKKEYAETILSIAPVLSELYHPDYEVEDEVKEHYRNKLSIKLLQEDLDGIIFFLYICVGIGCWVRENESGIITQIMYLYKHHNTDSYMGCIRYKQVSGVLEKRCYNVVDNENERHEITWMNTGVSYNPDRFVFINDDKRFSVYVNLKKLSIDALLFFMNDKISQSALYNNIAYLLRRREVLEACLDDNTEIVQLTPEILLKEGIDNVDSFSIVNYALEISNTKCNTIGDFSVGREFLIGIKNRIYEYKYGMCWGDVIDWWAKHVLVKYEVEAVVVFSWLFELEILDVEKLASNTLIKTIKIMEAVSEFIPNYDASQLKKMVTVFENTIEERKQLKTVD